MQLLLQSNKLYVYVNSIYITSINCSEKNMQNEEQNIDLSRFKVFRAIFWLLVLFHTYNLFSSFRHILDADYWFISLYNIIGWISCHGILKQKNWARYTFLIPLMIGLYDFFQKALGGLEFQYNEKFHLAYLIFVFLLSLLQALFFLWLLFRPKMNEYFRTIDWKEI